MHLFCALACAVILAGGTARAQPLSYDPYYVLPGGQGYSSVDLGLGTPELSSLGDMSDLLAMAKFSINDQLEAGARFTFGFLNDGASNFSSLVVGAKYKLSDSRAINANIVVPAGDIDDPGFSIGLMNTTQLTEGLLLNGQLHLGLFDGYTGGTGMVIDALIEPAVIFNDKFSGYLDLLVTTNTDSFGDFLSVNLAPNLDIGLGDGVVLNLGVSFGLAGDAKQAETGFVATVLRDM